MSRIEVECDKTPAAVSDDPDSDNLPIWDRAVSKRRKSRSRQPSEVAERQLYLQPANLAEIFPNLGPKVICQLAEMVSFTPVEVQSLVPKATTKQICLFFDLVKAASTTPASNNALVSREGAVKSVPEVSLLEQLRKLEQQR